MDIDTPLPPLRPLEAIPVREDERDYIVLRDPSGLSESLIAVAREAASIITLFDGRTTARQIADQVNRAAGLEQGLDAEELVNMARMLDEAFLLESEAFQRHREDMIRTFRDDPVRRSSLAGGGYPEDPAELGALLDRLLTNPDDDDMEAEELPKGAFASAALLPHIDYGRGGATYGRGYRRLHERLPDPADGPLLVGIIGVAHQGALAPLVAADKDFETPLGTLEKDRRALELIRNRIGEEAFREEWAHRSEHSVELQAVWVKHLLKDREVTLLPLLAGTLDAGLGTSPRGVASLELWISVLREIEASHPGPVLWLASVDFSHLGPHFGDADPVDRELQERTARADMKALEAVRKGDAERWWETADSAQNPNRICGLAATYVLLRVREGEKGYVADYQQAVAEDQSQLVSYASVLFGRP